MFTILTLFMSLFFVQPSFGALIDSVNVQTNALTGSQGAQFGTPRDPRSVVAIGIQKFLFALGIVMVAFTVYAGALILLSGGEEDKITKGRDILVQSVIGLVIILSAYGITRMVSLFLDTRYEDNPSPCINLPADQTIYDNLANDISEGTGVGWEPGSIPPCN